MVTRHLGQTRRSDPAVNIGRIAASHIRNKLSCAPDVAPAQCAIDLGKARIWRLGWICGGHMDGRHGGE